MPAPRNQEEANAQALVESKINVENVDREEAIAALDVDTDFFDTLRPENFADPEYTIEARPEPYGDAEFDDEAAQKAARANDGKYPEDRGPADDVEAQKRALGVDSAGDIVNAHNNVDEEEDEDFDPSDPSASTVEQVKEYIRNNPDKEDEVLKAERKGQARKTLVG